MFFYVATQGPQQVFLSMAPVATLTHQLMPNTFNHFHTMGQTSIMVYTF